MKPADVEKYDLFKIVNEQHSLFYCGHGHDESIVEFLYFKKEGGWRNVLYHTISEWDPESDRFEMSSKPLVPVMYVDMEYQFYYLENEEGILYYSPDRIKWYFYMTTPEKRPYYNRLDGLRRFSIRHEDRT